VRNANAEAAEANIIDLQMQSLGFNVSPGEVAAMAAGVLCAGKGKTKDQRRAERGLKGLKDPNSKKSEQRRKKEEAKKAAGAAGEDGETPTPNESSENAEIPAGSSASTMPHAANKAVDPEKRAEDMTDDEKQRIIEKRTEDVQRWKRMESYTKYKKYLAEAKAKGEPLAYDGEGNPVALKMVDAVVGDDADGAVDGNGEPQTPKPRAGQPKRAWKYSVESWRRAMFDFLKKVDPDFQSMLERHADSSSKGGSKSTVE